MPDVVSLKNLVQTPQAVRAASNVLMLVGRPNDSIELCVSSHDFGAAYEQMMLHGRFDDAAALLAAHDTDLSPAVRDAAMFRGQKSCPLRQNFRSQRRCSSASFATRVRRTLPRSISRWPRPSARRG